ncbi:hypothetical protein M422DRAFT_46600 [Sphaerobolus stellatus SS14]|uniref:Unplaced genomic scaffold SPHSTscaffold_36, whole genome shotgun sequence n=1 Tax=Sphaerobolus stellatus (strain SS14) TaxID=990650 RepID=A0A0C9VSQ4_SPHS4|nr:hypothetical protein M422DRAFT_46600 [Sphaerobolus stellatus SS14]
MMVEWDDTKKLKNFELYLEDEAEKWWEDPRMTTRKESWAAASKAFSERFPSIKDTEESKTITYKHLIACVLKQDELGKTAWDENKKKDILTHTAWAHKMARLAAAYGDTTAAALPFIRTTCIPKILSEMLEDQYDSYTGFTEAVSKIKLEKIKAACEKSNTIEELKAAVANQRQEMNRWATSRQLNPWNTPQTNRTYSSFTTSPQALSRFRTPATPQTPAQNNTTPPGLQTPMNCLNPYRTTPQTLNASPFERHDPPVVPRNNNHIDLGPFPDTQDGWQHHTAAVARWNEKWGVMTQPAPERPYPLSPGTSPIGTRECFQCGRRTEPPHSARENRCIHPHVNQVEKAYRAQYQFGLNTTGYQQPPGTPSPALRQTAPVHHVGTIEEVAEEYTEYYNQFGDDQGNEEGSHS